MKFGITIIIIGFIGIFIQTILIIYFNVNVQMYDILMVLLPTFCLGIIIFLSEISTKRQIKHESDMEDLKQLISQMRWYEKKNLYKASKITTKNLYKASKQQ